MKKIIDKILPEIDDFFLQSPLYEKYTIDESHSVILFDLIYFTDKLDCYCTSCEKDSTFIGTNPASKKNRFHHAQTFEEWETYGEGHNSFLNKIYQINFYFTRVESHKMQQSIILTQNELFKIGQYPSIADISQPELKKYRNVLSKEKYLEFSRGIGLITHGIGVGSFVYLRRIFEDLIEEAHIKLMNSENWDETIYSTLRMADKIGLLSSELPEFLVENKSIYSILSKGIHELTENECLEYFPSVKLGIELILDEKLEKKKKEIKIKLAKKSIVNITKEFKDK